MVLVDSSIWIQHFRQSDDRLISLLRNNKVLAHPMVIGELACGSLKQRSEILPLLQLLPQADSPSQNEVLHFIDRRKIFGKGVGWVDVHLLASCVLSDALLWTSDKSLLKQAHQLGLRY
jgi:predicted nucleic acid-binding protein